jgi:ACR3 family arsenite transporter
MLYPPLAKVRYEDLPKVFSNKKILGLSLAQNWLVGPLLMALLAVLFLRDRPEYMIGLIMLGLARCISMVMIWNDAAGGDREYCAGLVALNAMFQVVFFPVYVWLFLTLLPRALGLGGVTLGLDFMEIISRKFIYLGLPFIAAIVTRFIFIGLKGWDWYYKKFIPAIEPLAIIVMLLTIIARFSLRGDDVLGMPLEALRVAVPLLFYLAVMFFSSLVIANKSGASYQQAVALSLTSASNNFELIIITAIATFGMDNGAVFAALIGLLVEVPVLIGLAKLSLRMGWRISGAFAAAGAKAGT